MSNELFKNSNNPNSSFRNTYNATIPEDNTNLFANSVAFLPDSRTGIIDNQAYNIDPTKYTRYLDTVRPYVGLDDLNSMRALNQSKGEKALHFLGRSVLGEIIGGGLQGLGSILEIPGAIIEELSGGSADYNNFMTEWGNSVMNYATESMPIHRRNPGKAFDFGDFGYWAESGVSIASALGLMIPGLAGTKAVSMLGKTLRLSRNLSDSTKFLAKIGTNAVIMRNAENMREGFAVINAARQNAKAAFSSSEDFNNWLSTQEGKEFIKDQQDFFGGEVNIETASDWIGAKAGWRSYQINSANIAFDVIQSAALFKSLGTRSTGVFTSKLEKATNAALLKEPVKKSLLGTVGRGLTDNTRMIASIVGEGVEEMVNFVGSEQGKQYAEDIIESGKTDGVFAGISKAIGSYINDPHMWENFLWGSIGGGVFEAGGSLVSRLTHKKDVNMATKLNEISNRYKTLQGHTKTIATIDANEKLTPEEKDTAKQVANESLVFNIAYNASLAGNMDLVSDMITKPELHTFNLEKIPVEDRADFQARVNETIAKLKVDAASVEAGVIEARKVYSTFNNIDPIAKSGLIKQYTYHKFNKGKRFDGEVKADNNIVQYLAQDSNYNELVSKGVNVNAHIKAEFLTLLKGNSAFKGFSDKIDLLIKKEEEKFTVKPSAKDLSSVNTSLVLPELLNYYTNMFSRMESEEFLSKATSKNFVNGFNEAVVDTIKEAKEKNDKDEVTNFEKRLIEDYKLAKSQAERDAVINKYKGLTVGNKQKEKTTIFERFVADQIKREKEKNAKTAKPLVVENSDVSGGLTVENPIVPITVENPVTPTTVFVPQQVKSLNLEQLKQDKALIDQYVPTLSSRDDVQDLLDILDDYLAFGKELPEDVSQQFSKLSLLIKKLTADGEILDSTDPTVYTNGKIEVRIVKTYTDINGDKRILYSTDKGQGTVTVDSFYRRFSPISVVEPVQETAIQAETQTTANEEKQVVGKYSESFKNFISRFPNRFSTVLSLSDLFELFPTDLTMVFTGNIKGAEFKYTSDINGIKDPTIFLSNVDDVDFDEKLAHELIHALTIQGHNSNSLFAHFSRPAESKNSPNPVYKFVVPKEYKGSRAGEILYTIKNSDNPILEFIAYGLSNREFHNMIFSHKGNTSTFGKLLKYVSDSSDMIGNEVFLLKRMTGAGTTILNYTPPANVKELADLYGINLDNLGLADKESIEELRNYINQNNLEPISELQHTGVYSNTSRTFDNTVDIYIPFVQDAIRNNRIDTIEYNNIINRRFGDKAINYTEDELVATITEILSPELNTGSNVTIRKSFYHGYQVLHNDVIIGYLNNPSKVQEMVNLVQRLISINSIEELNKFRETRTFNFGENSYVKWKEQELLNGADVPLSTGLHQLVRQFENLDRLRNTIDRAGEVVVKVALKTSGQLINGDPISIKDIPGFNRTLFYKEPLETLDILTSVNDNNVKFFRNEHATKRTNVDLDYTHGFYYTLIRGANSIDGDLQSFIPTRLEPTNLKETEVNTIIDDIQKLIVLAQRGVNMLGDPSVIEIKERINALINVESYKRESKNYMNVTTDQIKYSFWNSKLGEYNHVHIKFKSKFNNKPYIYITKDKAGVSERLKLPGGKQTVSFGETEAFNQVLRRTLSNKKISINTKLANSKDLFIDGKTYIDYLIDNDYLTTIVQPLRKQDGSIVADKRGNALFITGKHTGGINQSNIIISVETSTIDNNPLDMEDAFNSLLNKPVEEEEIAIDVSSEVKNYIAERKRNLESKDDFIADFFVKGRITSKSFKDIHDPNDFKNKGINFVSNKKGVSADVVADELSERSGLGITVGDIAAFVASYKSTSDYWTTQADIYESGLISDFNRAKKENVSRKFLKIQQSDEEFIGRDTKALEAWWNGIFTNVPFDPNVTKIIVREGISAWGVFENGMVSMYKNATKGTEYHEAYHVVHNMYLNQTQKELIEAAAKEVYGNMTSEDIEERIAEDFRAYMLSEGKTSRYNEGNIITRYFKRLYAYIKYLIKSVIGKNNYKTRIEYLFDKISSGGFKNKPIIGNPNVRRFSKLDSFTGKEIDEVTRTMIYYMIEDIGEDTTFGDIAEDVNLKTKLLNFFEDAKQKRKGTIRENYNRVIANFDAFYERSLDRIRREFNLTPDDSILADKEITKKWDDKTIFRNSSKETVSNRIKKEIMTTRSAKDSEFLKSPMFVSFNETFPYIMDTVSTAPTINEMLNRLHRIAKFNKDISNFVAKIEHDDSLIKLLYFSFKKQKYNRIFVGVEDTIDTFIGNPNKTQIQSNKWINESVTLINSLEGEKATEFINNLNSKRKDILKRIGIAGSGIFKDTVNASKEILSLIGINISDLVLELSMSERKNPKGFYNEIIDPVIKAFAVELSAYNKDPENYKFNSYGRYLELADVLNVYNISLNESSSLNINGDTVFNYTSPSFLSDFFDKISAITDKTTVDSKTLLDNFTHNLEDYLKDPANSFSNWLNADTINKDGLFNTITGSVNVNALSKFKLHYFEGITNLNNRVSEEYSSMDDNLWLLSSAAMYLHANNNLGATGNDTILTPITIPSDGSNIFFIESHRFTGVDPNGTVKRKDIHGNWNPIWMAVYNTTLQEIERIKTARDLLFYYKDEDFIPKTHKENADPNSETELDYRMLQTNYHFTEKDQNDLPIIAKFVDGKYKPTGRVFQFFNIRSLNSISVEEQGVEFPILDNGIFVADLFDNTDIQQKIYVEIGKHVDKFIRSESTKVGKNLVRVKDNIVKIKNYQNYASFNQFVVEFTMNQYISNVEQMNMFTGVQAEFKSDKDFNKRAKQIVSPGSKISLEKSTFTAQVIEDVVKSSDIIPGIIKKAANALHKENKFKDLKYNAKKILANKDLNELEQAIYNIISGYTKTVTSDAGGFVLTDRYTSILEASGKLTPAHKRILKKLNNYNYRPTVSELKIVMQPLKGFYYTRKYDPYLNRFISVQIKYATTLLSKALVAGTEGEKLLRWAELNKLDEIMFASAQKLVATHIININSSDGGIDTEKLVKYSRNNGHIFRTYSTDSWVLQSEHPEHIVDSTNKLGLQISKLQFNNIKDKSKYKFRTTDANGKVTDYTLTGQEIKTLQGLIRYANIQESAEQFANSVTNDNLTVNFKKLTNIIKEQGDRKGYSANIMDSFITNEDGDIRIPLYIPTISGIVEPLIMGMVTNRIVEQRIAGGSAIVVPSTFFTKFLTDKRSSINWLKRKVDANDYELKMTNLSKDGKTVTKAEVLLPAYTQQFFTKGVIDINKLSEDVRTSLWFRMPFETKHSGLQVEVVGFLPNSVGNIIIMPHETITQSGEDADFDKRYGITYTYENDKNNNLKKIDFIFDENDPRLFERWKKTKFAKTAIKFVDTSAIEDAEVVREELKEKYETLKLAKEARKTIKEQADAVLIDRDIASKEELSKLNAHEIYFLLNEELTSIEAIIESAENYGINDINKDLYQQAKDIHDTFKELVENYGKTVKELTTATDNIKTIVSQLESGSAELKIRKSDLVSKLEVQQRAVFDQLGIVNKNTLDARNNLYLDLLIAILQNPDHFIETISPSSFVHIADVVKEIESIIGIENQDFNPSLPSAQLTFRARNIAGIAMKGMAVNASGFLSIAQQTKLELIEDLKIPVKYHNLTQDTNSLVKKYGKENVITNPDNSIIILHNKFGWNNDNSFTDIHGNLTTDNLAEVLAQVLDIVKEGFVFNINTYTFNIWTTMLQVGIPIRDASFFFANPVVRDISRQFFDNTRVTSEVTENEIARVKTKYTTNLFKVRLALNKIPRIPLAELMIKRLNKTGEVWITPKDAQKFGYNNVSDAIQKIFNYTIPTKDNRNYQHTSISIEEIKEQLVEYKDLKTSIDKIDTIDKTDKVLLNRLNNLLRKQLLVLEMFSTFRNTSIEVENLTKVLQPDKGNFGERLLHFQSFLHNLNIATFSRDGIPKIVTDVNNKKLPATVAIYPKLFTDNTITFKNSEYSKVTHESKYPIFEALVRYASQLSYDIFASQFIEYYPAFRTVVNAVNSNLGAEFNSERDQRITSYVKYLLGSNTPFLKVNNSELKRLLGVGQNPVVREDGYDYNTLSVANKLRVLKEEYKDTLDPAHVLYMFSEKTTKNDVVSNGFQKVEFENVTSNDILMDDIIRQFNKMYNGYLTDVYDERVSDLVKDLIKYSFHTTSFSTKYKGFSTLISPSMLEDIGYVDQMRNEALRSRDPNYVTNNYSNIIDLFLRNNASTIPLVRVNLGLNIWKQDRVTKIITLSDRDYEFLSPKLKNSLYVRVPLYKTYRLSDGTYKNYYSQTVIYKYAYEKDGKHIYIPLPNLGSKFLLESTYESVLPVNTPLISETMYGNLVYNENATINVNGMPYPVGLPTANEKDMMMFLSSTGFIGKRLIGTGKSATNTYAGLFGAFANSGEYFADDLIMISAQGMRDGVTRDDLSRTMLQMVDGKVMFKDVYENIDKALESGATVMVASAYDENNRSIKGYNKDYNIGDSVVRSVLNRRVKNGELAYRIEAGIIYYAKSEANLNTINRGINIDEDVREDDIDTVCNIG